MKELHRGDIRKGGYLVTMKQRAAQCFAHHFGLAEPLRYLFAPGRINLIGEHTDYNGGYVMPTTISRGIYAAVRRREDRCIQLVSESYADRGVQSFSLDSLPSSASGHWYDYVLGMVLQLREEGFLPSYGFDMALVSDVPIESGLSSSHALMILTGLVLGELFGFPFQDEGGRRLLAQASMRCENNYVGLSSGIMDGFAIALGGQDEALWLQCSTQTYQRIPLHFGEHELWIVNSHMPRDLVTSAYNQRYAECQEALHALQQAGVDIDVLAELTPDLFAQHESKLHGVAWQRARHVVYENERTYKAASALASGDMYLLGRLFTESHRSLSVDYEVAGHALDSLAELCLRQEACLGARLTGAGFGGCLISLWQKEHAEVSLQRVARSYSRALGLKPTYFRYQPGVAGAL